MGCIKKKVERETYWDAQEKLQKDSGYDQNTLSTHKKFSKNNQLQQQKPPWDYCEH